LANQGITTAIHYPIPDHRQPFLTDTLAARISLPVTEHASEHVLSLPCFPEMTDAEVDRVCQTLSDG
jgi:dTDP-4-amino-4,6-dideoxygalactose transaminase